MTCAAVPPGAGRQRAEQVDLSVELDEVARSYGTRFHEVLVRPAQETCTHEHVQHVVDERLRVVERDVERCMQGTGQIRMAAVMLVGASEQSVGVRVTPGADDVMHAGSIIVKSVPLERVMCDGGEGPQIGQIAPQPVAAGDMRGVELTGLAAEETLREVVRVPQVQIADLRAVDADDAKNLTGRNAKRAGFTRWYGERIDSFQFRSKRTVAFLVVRGQLSLIHI